MTPDIKLIPFDFNRLVTEKCLIEDIWGTEAVDALNTYAHWALLPDSIRPVDQESEVLRLLRENSKEKYGFDLHEILVKARAAKKQTL